MHGKFKMDVSFHFTEMYYTVIVSQIIELITKEILSKYNKAVLYKKRLMCNYTVHEKYSMNSLIE